MWPAACTSTTADKGRQSQAAKRRKSRHEMAQTMNPLLELNQRGQFVWLHHIRRSLIRGGGLQRLIDEDGLGGVTSNPPIFEKAIAGSPNYDPGQYWRRLRPLV